MRRPALRALVVGLLVLPALLPAPSARAQEPIAVIVSREWVGIDRLALSTLRRLYLGRIARVAGRRVQRFHLQSGSPAREAFSQSVLGRSEAALREYWLEQALTGGVLPPGEFASPAAMMQYVRAHPGAIGYVPHGALGDPAALEGLRVLGVSTGTRALLPSDPAYPIRQR